MADTRPTFSRLTEGSRATQSWKAALPAVVVVVAVLALVAYLASALSSSEQRAMTASRDNQQLREQQGGLTKQIGDLQKDLALARNPGRTTVILTNVNKDAKDGVWAAVTWGESPDGKTWMRAQAYGLGKPEGGRIYHVWFQPQTGDPVLVGTLEVDQNGSSEALTMGLPALAEGKSAMLTMDAPDSKVPGEVVAQTDLPKLESTVTAVPPPAGDQPQARPGESTQPMHQLGK